MPNIAAINRLWITFQFHPDLDDTTNHGGTGEYLVDNLRFIYVGGQMVLIDGFGDPPPAEIPAQQ